MFCYVLLFQQLSKILKDPESSSNDKFVALELLKNACIAAGMVLPGCQDTGTAICMGRYDYWNDQILLGHVVGGASNIYGESSSFKVLHSGEFIAPDKSIIRINVFIISPQKVNLFDTH